MNAATTSLTDRITNLAEKMYARHLSALRWSAEVPWRELDERSRDAWEDLACFALHNGFDDLRRTEDVETCMLIRCIEHHRVPQYNTNEASGAECPACEIEPLRQDAQVMAMRLLGEPDDTLSTECAEVMARWRPKCEAILHCN